MKWVSIVSNSSSPLLGLTFACDALGGPDAVFDFQNPNDNGLVYGHVTRNLSRVHKSNTFSQGRQRKGTIDGTADCLHHVQCLFVHLLWMAQSSCPAIT